MSLGKDEADNQASSCQTPGGSGSTSGAVGIWCSRERKPNDLSWFCHAYLGGAINGATYEPLDYGMV
jgi:hypothetical protein